MIKAKIEREVELVCDAAKSSFRGLRRRSGRMIKTAWFMVSVILESTNRLLSLKAHLKIVFEVGEKFILPESQKAVSVFSFLQPVSCQHVRMRVIAGCISSEQTWTEAVRQSAHPSPECTNLECAGWFLWSISRGLSSPALHWPGARSLDQVRDCGQKILSAAQFHRPSSHALCRSRLVLSSISSRPYVCRC